MFYKPALFGIAFIMRDLSNTGIDVRVDSCAFSLSSLFFQRYGPLVIFILLKDVLTRFTDEKPTFLLSTFNPTFCENGRGRYI